MQATGYLLINLGTPASASTRDVRRYLDQFLMDPYVIDLPWPLRRLLVSAFILPFRPKRSARAYASIWTEQGSPLLAYSRQLRASLDDHLNGPVALGMRYGEPSIERAVAQLLDAGVERLVVVPLYPQYADSTVTTCLDVVRALTAGCEVAVSVVPPFYGSRAYLNAQAQQISDHLPADWDHLLLSYHGLPERHLTRADPTGSHCLASEDCCVSPSPAHATCYRHQVLMTSQHLAQALALRSDQYSLSFQSRLGRLPWLQPYTDQVLAELPGRGVRRLVVAAPAFVADNLETLEELGLQGEETFLRAGGETFHLVPCLNASVAWVEALVEVIGEATNDQNVAARSETSV